MIPKEPQMSCPFLDSAIEEIEESRKIHSALRDWGKYWKEAYYELEKDSSNEIDRLKDEIKELEDETSALKDEIYNLNKQS